MRRTIVRNASLVWCAWSACASATGFDFQDFSSVSNLNLIGTAQQLNDAIRLTDVAQNQVGGFWFTEKQTVGDGFVSMFSFRINNDGADGFAFVIQGHSASALGEKGGGLGYHNVL